MCATDGSAHEIVWVGGRRLYDPRHFGPVHIAAGALGAGCPEKAVRLSPHHRVLVESRIVERMCDNPVALVPARALVDLPGVRHMRSAQMVTYYHVLTAQHIVLDVDGLPAETLFLGHIAMRLLSRRQRAEIAACGIDPSPMCAPTFSMQRGMRLVARHVQNRKPLVQSTLVIPERA